MAYIFTDINKKLDFLFPYAGYEIIATIFTILSRSYNIFILHVMIS